MNILHSPLGVRSLLAVVLVVLLSVASVYSCVASAHEDTPTGTWDVQATHTSGPEKGTTEHFVYQLRADGTMMESSGTAGDAAALGSWHTIGPQVTLDYFAPTSEQASYLIELQRHLLFHANTMNGMGKVIVIDSHHHQQDGGNESITATRLLH